MDSVIGITGLFGLNGLISSEQQKEKAVQPVGHKARKERRAGSFQRLASGNPRSVRTRTGQRLGDSGLENWTTSQTIPDIQEALLFLTRSLRGRDPLILADLQSLATTLDWGQQRRRWQRLLARRPSAA
jgi:hypothetical protein